MKRCQLALAVKETEYLRRFAEYVRGSSFGERWQVAAFTNAEACRQYAKQGYAVDLVAAEPELLLELQDKLPDVPAVALVGKLGESRFEHELVQYQPLPALLKSMTELHAALSGYRNRQPAGRDGERARVIAVHSASGGVGKTTAALHLVHAAGSRDLKAFYLNLERWNAVQLLVPDQAETGGAGADNGLSGLLYAVKAQPGQWEQAVHWLSGRVLYHPVLKGDYLPPFANPDDRLTLAAEDAAALIGVVARTGRYDIVVVDLDDGLDELHMAVLERADSIVSVIGGEWSSMHKHRLSSRYGLQKWGARYRDAAGKSILVRNGGIGAPDSSRGSAQEAHGPDLPAAVMPEVPEWRSGAGAALLSSPVYRAAADKLLRRLTGEEEAASDGIR